MQRAAIICILLLLSVPGVQGTTLDGLHFMPPGQVGQELGVSGAQWLVIVFSNQTTALADLAFSSPVVGNTYQEIIAEENESILYSRIPVGIDGVPPTSRSLPPLSAHLAFP